jgi:hypothetical protein
MTEVTAVALREESLAGGAAIMVWLLAGVWLTLRFPAARPRGVRCARRPHHPPVPHHRQERSRQS